jgi:signal transduction histidine kinase
MTSPPITSRASLTVARRRMGALFAVTLLVIVGVLGGGLFVTLRRGYEQELDRSLVAAVSAVISRAQAAQPAPSEIIVPERTVHVFDAAALRRGDTASGRWESDAARLALRDSVVRLAREVPGEVEHRLLAVRFHRSDGSESVAVVTADQVELENRYGTLLVSFAVAAGAALLLASLAAWVLARRATEPAERAMEQLERFTADAAHELRTPLAVLRTRTEVALQAPRDVDHYLGTLRDVQRDALRASRVVDDLLVLARADSGAVAAPATVLALDDLVIEAAEPLRVLARERAVDLVVSEFEEAPVAGDAALLRRLVTILLDNAVRYSHDGGRVTVRVGLRGRHATVVVSDTGRGIEPDELPHLFNRFFRGRSSGASDHSREHATDGAGLGLAIARWIADVHGARIEVQSAVGIGSTFAVVFPPVS